MKILRWLWQFIISVRFAVLVIIGIAASLAVGTFLESYYDTRTAGYFVYRALWFKCLLGALGTLILAVALSRFPWRKSHLPFLLAHAGILILLGGSWVSQEYGLDGQMRLREGEVASAIDFEDEIVAISDGQALELFTVPWTPPTRHARPILLPKYGIRIDEYVTHAEPHVAFQAQTANQAAAKAAPALKLKIEGGPMRISQEFWLWAGDPAWSIAPMGPAKFMLLPSSLPGPTQKATSGEAVMEFWMTPKGELAFHAISRRNEVKSGRFTAAKIQGSVIDPGWMGIKLTVVEWIPSALNQTSYRPAKIQFGDQAPPSAIHLHSIDSPPESGVWVGMGDQSTFQVGGRQVSLSYTNRRVILPFGLKLHRFTIDHYQGTRSPSSYSSNVSVVGGRTPAEAIEISMNEPLKYGGYIFYQSSYVPEEPRPVVSILSVNHDPGRWLKYVGSLLIVLGSILLFAAKRIRKKAVA
jgi:hypothetical protein